MQKIVEDIEVECREVTSKVKGIQSRERDRSKDNGAGTRQ